MDKLKQFYNSRTWRSLSHQLKIERGYTCERTGITVTNASELIAHHKIELTESNVDDPNISLNPDNIEIILFSEHNKEHRRFGTHDHGVYIVYGSPLSGKTTLVRETMRKGDIVVDIDMIWEAVTLSDNYDKPNNLKFNVFTIRDNLIDQIKTRFGGWIDAYIIGGYPNKTERDRLQQRLNAELIYVDSTKDECLQRLHESNRPKVWEEYITQWWDEYRP